MLGLLADDGYTFVSAPEDADVILVNTCAFIGDAKEESINTILDMAQYKQDGNCKLLIVTGCLAERYHEEIKKRTAGGRRSSRHGRLRRYLRRDTRCNGG